MTPARSCAPLTKVISQVPLLENEALGIENLRRIGGYHYGVVETVPA